MADYTPPAPHESHQAQREHLRFPTPTARYEDAMMRYLGAVHYVSRHLVDTAEQADKPGQAGHREQEPPDSVLQAVDAAVSRKVGEIMSRDPVSVRVGTPFVEIARTLVQARVNAVPVLDTAGRVAGVVSESNLLARAASLGRPAHGPLTWLREHGSHAHDDAVLACDLMSTPAITTTPDDTAGHAAWLAARRKIKLLPVVDADGVLVGVVTRGDLIRTFLPQE